MKLSNLTKYQLQDMKYVFIILYAIIIASNLFGFQVMVISNEQSSNSAMDMGSNITFFITVMCCFSETFKMWIQNGLSRKTIFKGLLAGTFAISGICTVLNFLLSQIFALIFKKCTSFTSISYFFRDYFDSQNLALEIFMNLLFMFITSTAFIMLGYLISILFYRSGKFMRIGIAAGLPIFTFVIIPMLISFWYNTVFFQHVISFFYTILGLKSGNPFYLIASTSIVSLILVVINYLLISKLQLRNS